MAKLCAFSDEISPNLEEQLRFLNAENIRYMEIRNVNGQNISDLSHEYLRQAKTLIDAHNIKAAVIGSPIGKTKMDQPFEPHFEKFKHCVDDAVILGAEFIRIFSFYPPDGQNIQNYRAEVIERMRLISEYAKPFPVTLVHENEGGIYGETAQRCVDLAQAIGYPNFRLAYDPGNFVWHLGIRDNIKTCWPLMKPYVRHIHIKDWQIGQKTGAIPGQGDGQIELLLAELKRMNYDGFITMEPHLKIGGQFGGVTDTQLYSQAIREVRRLAQSVKLDV